MNTKLSHTNDKGKANMVDVGDKPLQHRTAIAKGRILLSEDTVSLIRENELKKGDVLTVAEIAGIQAAKETSRLIPLCHPLQLTKVEVKTQLTETGVEVSATARCLGQTGVEMEALTAVSVALLTIYDMCKAVDKTMVISDISLIEKVKTDLES
ncbi:MAG: cyclic pyranopterin monophosphate synthase MoaC [Bacteroidetes bacterium HGW-Bacteroidetes-11]|jgi:cyclic pyranopterin phosphate synthase|nr:MAG: cyclic pyranopterin monophosphate synthase MoaC [Bacteroidetes bacterium HGW-Bacteroidetes-11]